MCYPTYELSQEIQNARLREADNERLRRQLPGGHLPSLSTKLLLGFADLLVNSGLKLKQVARFGVAS